MNRTFFGALALLAALAAAPAVASPDAHDESVKSIRFAELQEPGANPGGFATRDAERQLEAVEIDGSSSSQRRPHQH